MSLILRGIDFGSVFNAPGARGMWGKLYWYQKPLAPFHLWEGATFAAKTMTWDLRLGNMPLREDGDMPVEHFPKCIIVKPLSGHMLNCVNLSNFGVQFYLDQGIWQIWPQPMVISFMAVGDTREERVRQTINFTNALKKQLPFLSPVAIHLNFGCPNTGEDMDQLHSEVSLMLDIVAQADIPLLASFGPTTALDVIIQAVRHEACDGLWLANTLPWERIPTEAKFKIFGALESPLEKHGFQSGGLSGPECLPFLLKQLSVVREKGVNKPIVAGGGIQTCEAVRLVHGTGANGIALGAIVTRPWRMQPVIRYAKKLFGGG